MMYSAIILILFIFTSRMKIGKIYKVVISINRKFRQVNIYFHF